jgi:hypothetical protein
MLRLLIGGIGGLTPFSGSDGVRLCPCSPDEFHRGVASSPTPMSPRRSIFDGSKKYGEAGERV